MALWSNVGLSIASVVAIYAAFLGCLTSEWFQAQAVYLHKLRMTLFDLFKPEHFGFLHGQVSYFFLKSHTGHDIFAWHILPLEISRARELHQIDSQNPSHVDLLRNDPEARLVIHFHGAGGTVGSGYRVPKYRALSAAHPSRIHVLTFDYGGFGESPGTPSEESVVLDALAVCEWALETAGISPERILLFSQSLGTAVNLAVAEHFASQSPSVLFAGHILVAPSVNVATLLATYKIAGTIPLISPLTRFPAFFMFLQGFIRVKWSSSDRIRRYVQTNERAHRPYHISILHAEDDWDIPSKHSDLLYWHAVSATEEHVQPFDSFQQRISKTQRRLGSAGLLDEHKTSVGLIQKRMLEIGLHDVIMGFSVLTAEVARIFSAVDPIFSD